MLQLIATTVLIGSLTGMGVILYRKTPDLKALPLSKKRKSSKNLGALYSKLESLSFPGSNFFENILQKLLSKTKILALKIENKSSQALQKMREKSVERERVKKDKYWQRLKRSVSAKRRKKK